MFSPSMATIASVRSVTIFFFCVSLKTPSMSFTLIRGIGHLLRLARGGFKPRCVSRELIACATSLNCRDAAILDRDAELPRREPHGGIVAEANQWVSADLTEKGPLTI